ARLWIISTDWRSSLRTASGCAWAQPVMSSLRELRPKVGGARTFTPALDNFATGTQPTFARVFLAFHGGYRDTISRRCSRRMGLMWLAPWSDRKALASSFSKRRPG